MLVELLKKEKKKEIVKYLIASSFDSHSISDLIKSSYKIRNKKNKDFFLDLYLNITLSYHFDNDVFKSLLELLIMDKEYKEFKYLFRKILKLNFTFFSDDNLFLVTILAFLFHLEKETSLLFKELLRRGIDEFIKFWYVLWCKKQNKKIKAFNSKESFSQCFFKHETSLYIRSVKLIKQRQRIKDFDNVIELNFYLGLLYLKNNNFEGAYSFFCSVVDSDNNNILEFDIALFFVNVFGRRNMQELQKILF